jgi:hypothetical protein
LFQKPQNPKALFSKRLKFHFEFSKLASVYFKNLFVQSSWFKFEYLNQIPTFRFEKPPKRCFDFILF